jgi:hypothetical protein
VERENALFITQKENLSYLNPDFKRVHFGVEFCERLLPTKAELTETHAEVAGRGLAFTLVTPYVTEDGLQKVQNLLKLLPDGTEVVFNDWGVFRLLHEQFPQLVPVLGRMLTKIKRGPRIMNFIDRLPKDALDHLRSTNLGVPRYTDFLFANSIRRAELDNPLQGLNLNVIPAQLKLSLHIPFAYVSTTRFCLTANCDVPEKKGFIGVFPCGRECKRYTFFLDNAAMTTMLIRKGNTIFFRKTTVSPEMRESHIDRVIIAPEVPN